MRGYIQSNKSAFLLKSSLHVTEFNAITGYDVIANYNEKRIEIGTPRLNNNTGYNNNYQNINGNSNSKINELESEGKTVVTVWV